MDTFGDGPRLRKQLDDDQQLTRVLFGQLTLLLMFDVEHRENLFTAIVVSIDEEPNELDDDTVRTVSIDA
jgi:hypothetical protein